MSRDALEVNILASVGQLASRDVSGLEAKIKASMRATRDGDWMCAGEDAQFRGGVAGALLDVGSDSEDGKRITASFDVLAKFNAFITACHAGLSVDPPVLDESAGEPLPLLGWWHEIKREKPQ